MLRYLVFSETPAPLCARALYSSDYTVLSTPADIRHTLFHVEIVFRAAYCFVLRVEGCRRRGLKSKILQHCCYAARVSRVDNAMPSRTYVIVPGTTGATYTYCMRNRKFERNQELTQNLELLMLWNPRCKINMIYFLLLQQ